MGKKQKPLNPVEDLRKLLDKYCKQDLTHQHQLDDLCNLISAIRGPDAIEGLADDGVHVKEKTTAVIRSLINDLAFYKNLSLVNPTPLDAELLLSCADEDHYRYHTFIDNLVSKQILSREEVDKVGRHFLSHIHNALLTIKDCQKLEKLQADKKEEPTKDGQ